MACKSPRRLVITGASSGIGEALARHYALSGARVGLIARRKESLQRIAADGSSTFEAYAVDVRQAAEVASAARHFMERHGCPDLVIANAGVSSGTLTDCVEDNAVFQDIFETNVMGMVNAFQPFLAAMRTRGGGTLVGIASVAGYRGLPGAGAYSASKAAAIAYLESLRVELRSSGIKVITVCPGYVATSMTFDNPYSMPFIMSVEAAASQIALAIGRGRDYIVIPWQMAIVAVLLRGMPNWLFDRLFALAPRKPRRGS